MNVKYNLEKFGIDITWKQIPDGRGHQLSRRTLETILSFISSRYYNCEFQRVQINHKSFSNITNNYRHYLDYLVDKRIILIDEQYKVGEYCKNYMFNDYFKEHATIKSLKLGPKKENQVSDGSIEVDKMVLERLQQDIKFVIIKDEIVEKELMFYRGWQPIYDFKKYLSNEYNLLQLRQGRRDVWVKSERIYSPFVQLSKNIRTDYFSFDVGNLMSLDIKRSFPLWLSIWLLENNIYMDYDTKEFISSVKSGNFYNDLMMNFNRDRNLFNKTDIDRPFFDRNRTKDLFANWLNGDPTSKNLHNYVIRARYPLIYDFVKGYKNGEKEKMYHTLAGMESDFILNTVCKRLYQEIPGIRLLTCHDEIYFEERFNAIVTKIWDEELQLVYDRLPFVEETDTDFNKDELESVGIFCDFYEIDSDVDADYDGWDMDGLFGN